jgi:hypothetical protein
MDESPPSPGPLAGVIEQAVDDGIRRYFTARRDRVPGFVDCHFSLRGSLAVHRSALGLDVLRAPANHLLAGPHTGLKAVGLLAGWLANRHLAQRIAGRSLLLRTAVSRRVEWLVVTELLELPWRQRGRASHRDALAETILADPRLAAATERTLAVIAGHAPDQTFADRLSGAMINYAASRAAAAEITTSLLALSSGAVALKQLTPGAITLGPALAAALVQPLAIAAFPLGAGLGGLWYSMFPAAPPALLVAGVTSGLMVGASAVAAFAGLAVDPVQRQFGLHKRRLNQLIGALERQMLNPAAPAFAVHDHYVARLIDLFDILGSAYRLARG